MKDPKADRSERPALQAVTWRVHLTAEAVLLERLRAEAEASRRAGGKDRYRIAELMEFLVDGIEERAPHMYEEDVLKGIFSEVTRLGGRGMPPGRMVKTVLNVLD